jgi:hypothetical protein
MVGCRDHTWVFSVPAAPKASKKSGLGKKDKYLNFEWYEREEFEIDCLMDDMVADGGTVPGRTDVTAGTELYLVLWKGFPPEISTWEVSLRLHAAARAWACLLRHPPPVLPGRVRAPRELHRRVPRRARGERRRGVRGGERGGGRGGGRGRRHGRRRVTRRRVCMRRCAAAADYIVHSSSIKSISGDESLVFSARVPRVCGVCGLHRGGHVKTPSGGPYSLLFWRKYRWGALYISIHVQAVSPLANMAVGRRG